MISQHYYLLKATALDDGDGDDGDGDDDRDDDRDDDHDDDHDDDGLLKKVYHKRGKL